VTVDEHSACVTEEILGPLLLLAADDVRRGHFAVIRDIMVIDGQCPTATAITAGKAQDIVEAVDKHFVEDVDVLGEIVVDGFAGGLMAEGKTAGGRENGSAGGDHQKQQRDQVFG
jgi:hypothetical protein